MQTANLHPQIGVISDCALQRHMIQKALSNNGLEIALNCDPGLFEEQSNQRIQQVNCWILVMDDEDFESDAINALIEQTDIPVLFGLDKAPNKYDELYISWERRLFCKLEELLGQLNKFESESSVLSLTETSMPTLNQTEELEAPIFISQQRKLEGSVSKAKTGLFPASEVWVLAASLGGPAAVKAFLDLIPENIRASFLYAQHIDAHFSHVLTQVLGRHSKLNLMPLEHDQQLFDGEVRVVPVDHEVRFTDSTIKIMDTPWNGPYGPSIDHLLKNVVAGFGTKCHLMVFSGMGNDGAMTAPSMQKMGCQIWTQQPKTCASASMPQSIIDMNCSNLTATPEALAQTLIDRVGCHAQSQEA